MIAPIAKARYSIAKTTPRKIRTIVNLRFFVEFMLRIYEVPKIWRKDLGASPRQYGTKRAFGGNAPKRKTPSPVLLALRVWKILWVVKRVRWRKCGGRTGLEPEEALVYTLP